MKLVGRQFIKLHKRHNEPNAIEVFLFFASSEPKTMRPAAAYTTTGPLVTNKVFS